MHIIYFKQKIPELSAIILLVVAIYANEQNSICYTDAICPSFTHHIKELFFRPKEKGSNRISNLSF